ncbi:MAG: hypothetical protein IPQ09_31010 [Myxococcales bacterium]|nr:hypothetical protein [Myxococcales bacterium]
MSEPIIIETPAPPTRERLVLVPPSCVTEEYESQAGPRLGITGGVARDATPADLERAGYVTGEMLAEHVRIVWAAGQEAEPVGVAMLRRLKDRAEKAERELAETESHAEMRARILTARAEKAERERDDLLARINQAEEAARALRAELARLTALDRATDDELVDLYRKIYETHGGGTISVSHDDCRRAGVRTLAARVRQERCLVAQAVGMGTGVTISRTSERVPGTTGMWDVYVTRRPDVPGEHYAYGVPTADVPATLARLLGEVSRG